ncbi:hypothetical protein JWG40_14250 [Leptospira sp. 201903074]|uniref:hypothetical protein n=1 Tax=Leptospira abararensis TaxID=2810036 RepID=UPI0019666DCD|nr:hypothetical protein [Leptospira abararensis]MBM9548187.1 hypothetical protein [Leptospira abararensis]
METAWANNNPNKNKQVLTAEYKHAVTKSCWFLFQVNTGTQEKYKGKTANIFAASSVTK